MARFSFSETNEIYGLVAPPTPGPFRFGRKSESKLAQCNPLLVGVMREVIKIIDFTVIWTYRSNEKQAELLRLGRTLVGPGKSLHNFNPSDAIDIGVWRDGDVPWEDLGAFRYLAGMIQLEAFKQLGYILRWGGDWNRNHSSLDQKFHDLGHFEIPAFARAA